MSTILTLIAMDKEGKNFADNNGFVRSKKTLSTPEVPAEIYEKKISDSCSQILVISGRCPLHGVNRIGPSINLLAMTAIHTFKPDYLINAGFAGGFAKHAAVIGDVYIGNGRVFNHDRLFTDDDLYKAYCEGGFPVFDSSEIAAAIDAKTGQITSSGSMLASNEEKLNMERFGSTVKDMEAAAIAEVAFLMHVPFIPIKVISDYVDHPSCSQEQFNSNYPQLVAMLHNALLKTMHELAMNQHTMN